MQDFKYLGKNGFPNANNVNVYDYNNDFDYSRYDYSQMCIQVCSVPWEQGEAHIGQRTLSGIGNVVHFGNKENRNKWFDVIPDDECFRWETKYKELHSDLTLRIPLSFDIASKFNYVRVTYNLFANDESLINYESNDGMRQWFYFIREAHFIAPNTTKLVLLDDAWQTWIYDLDITNMILERGHAPLFAMQADNYLQNPINNCEYLLSEDINYGELQKVTSTQATILNADNMMAVIVSSSYPPFSADKWNNKTPGGSHYTNNGVPNMFVFAIQSNSLNDFLENVDKTIPQFKQTIQTIFFCEDKLLDLDNDFTFANVNCKVVNGSKTETKNILIKDKNKWGYDTKYTNLAKLYTYPYSALEISDENGNKELIKIEDTSDLTLDITANIIFPYINLTGIINGIGSSKTDTITFKNISSNSFTFGGRWYDYLYKWDIPTFAVVLDSEIEYSYSSYYDRLQANNDRTVNRDNSINLANASYNASVATANASYNASVATANAAKTIQENEADNVINNAVAQTTANTTVTSNSNSAATEDAEYVNLLAQAIQAYDAGLTRATVNIDIDAANQSTAISAAGGVVNSAAGGAIGGAMVGGAVGAAAGVVGGLVSGAIGAATSLATNSVMTNASSASAEASIGYSQEKTTATNTNNTSRTSIANNAKTANTTAQNTAISTSAANTSATMKENAETDNIARINAANTIKTGTIDAANINKEATIAAANNIYDNEGNKITNAINQAGLKAPYIYGQVTNGDTVGTRPLGLFVNVVTESDYAIKRAGDEFLRYGYYLDKQWDFNGNWCIGKHFTFWKLRDYWSTNQIPDRFADQIRFLLFGGITIWSTPESIGRISIYDNGI